MFLGSMRNHKSQTTAAAVLCLAYICGVQLQICCSLCVFCTIAYAGMCDFVCLCMYVNPISQKISQKMSQKYG